MLNLKLKHEIKNKLQIAVFFMVFYILVRNAYRILIRKPDGKNHLEDLGIDGRIL
jgi:hypothetical protein